MLCSCFTAWLEELGSKRFVSYSHRGFNSSNSALCMLVTIWCVCEVTYVIGLGAACKSAVNWSAVCRLCVDLGPARRVGIVLPRYEYNSGSVEVLGWYCARVLALLLDTKCFALKFVPSLCYSRTSPVAMRVCEICGARGSKLKCVG